MKVVKQISLFGYVQDGKMESSWHSISDSTLGAPFVLIMTKEVVFEYPDDFDFRTPAVKALEKEREDVRAELGSKLNLIEEQIGKLLCIEGPAS